MSIMADRPAHIEVFARTDESSTPRTLILGSTTGLTYRMWVLMSDGWLELHGARDGVTPTDIPAEAWLPLALLEDNRR